MAEPVIRPAVAADAGPLAILKLALFRETFLDGGFAIPYPADDLARFEEVSYAPASVVVEIADPGHATWLAERDGTLVGYAHVGPCKLPHDEVGQGAGELYQLYVAKGAQGTGLAGRLLDEALRHLEAARPGPVWLGVWSGNVRAQAFYARHGFRKVGDYRFPVGAWLDDEYIFRRD